MALSLARIEADDSAPPVGQFPEANPVLAWNATVLQALKQDTAAPLLVARTLAIVHLAQWEAQKAAPAAVCPMAISQAGCAAATTLLPGHRADFEKLRQREFATMGSAGTGRSGLAIGEDAARRVIEQRANDGSATQVSYLPHDEPGQWRRTPPFFRPPELIYWAAKVKPFVLDRPDQFRPTGPPALDSAEWAKAFHEIKTVGGRNSAERTPEQAAIAKFWSDFSNTETPPGHWNSIARDLAARRGLDLAETARLFAVLTFVDAGMACWDAKFHYNFWRPVTAIPRADEDGNAATAPNRDWLPLLATPAHPEYPSGHSVFSSAAAEVIGGCLGGDTMEITVRSDGLPNVERHFTSLRACAAECGVSRVYGGIHYRFSCEDGLVLGRQIGLFVLEKFAAPRAPNEKPAR